MKTSRFSVWIISVLFFAGTLKAQTSPEAFLSQLPAVPAIACSSDTAAMIRFTNQIFQVQASLKEVISRIQAEEQTRAEASESRIISDAIRKSGLSPNEVARLQRGGGTASQGRKAAEKIVGEQYNLSLDDLEKLGEMSDADQEKWAKEYAATMMSQSQQGGAGIAQNQAANARLLALANQQKSLGARITERMTRVGKIFQNVEYQDSIEQLKLDEQMRPLENQLCSGICTPAEIARSKVAEKEIYALKIRHCEKMSPLQVDAITQYLTTLKALLPDYRKLANVQNEMVRLQQVGVVTSDDLSAYSAVDEYADVLSGAYRYWVGKFEQ